MTKAALVKFGLIIKKISSTPFLRAFLAGLILPLSFAPFHIPGTAILSIALLYAQLRDLKNPHPILTGLFFGLGYFGLGTSWVYLSIRDYGHLNSLVAALITLFFLLYLALFHALMAGIFNKLSKAHWPLYSCLLFASLWILFEFARARLFSGFPWLLVGFGQFDAPSKYLLPIVGVFGVGFLTCFAATLVPTSLQFLGMRRIVLLTFFVLIELAPALLKPISWSSQNAKPLSVGIIQANLSMRDKWDETLFWQLLQHYKQATEILFGTNLIVMPESAIPLPPSYVEDYLKEIHEKAKRVGSAVILGIPKPTQRDTNSYYNALISLGAAQGSYLKQHLVPFGEYIPKAIQKISSWLAIPDANLLPGKNNQHLVTIQHHPIATLICYELAYGDILRRQLPQAEWIVSISDAGWFGHSLAVYQQLQMAQVRSLESSRYQIIANNDGLSSVINTQGELVASLPAFSEGILKTSLIPNSGVTPWIVLGDKPILIFCACIVLFFSFFCRFPKKVQHSPIAAEHKRGYPNVPY